MQWLWLQVFLDKPIQKLFIKVTVIIYSRISFFIIICANNFFRLSHDVVTCDVCRDVSTHTASLLQAMSSTGHAWSYKHDALLWLVFFQQFWLVHFDPCCFTQWFALSAVRCQRSDFDGRLRTLIICLSLNKFWLYQKFNRQTIKHFSL